MPRPTIPSAVSSPRPGHRPEQGRDGADAAAGRARRLLGIPARHEQVRRVPLYSGEVGLRILDDLQITEAHAEARAACVRHGFGAEPREGTPAWVEYCDALAASVLRLAVVDPSTGFPLWDTLDDLRGDLTREDIAYLDRLRLEHQSDVAPGMHEVTPAEVDALVAELVEEAKHADPKAPGSAQRSKPWPRTTLWRCLRFMAARLAASTGSTS